MLPPIFLFYGDYMNKIKASKIKTIVFAVLSVILCVCLAGVLVVTTLMYDARSYLTSQEFSDKIDTTDLSTLTFVRNDEKITLEQFVKDYVTENIQYHIKNNTASHYLSGYISFLFPLADSITDYTVDKALSSEYVNKVVKNEVHEIIEYILYSDVEEAEQRIRLGIDIHTNPYLSPDNTDNFEDRVSAEVKLAVFDYIEAESGKSIDEIIVALSEKTLESYKLKVISLALFLLLAVFNISSPVNLLAYFSVIAFAYYGAFAVIQDNFATYFAGNEDLISYQFIKPLMDLYVPYSDKAIVIGIVALALFVAIKVIMAIAKKKKA